MKRINIVFFALWLLLMAGTAVYSQATVAPVLHMTPYMSTEVICHGGTSETYQSPTTPDSRIVYCYPIGYETLPGTLPLGSIWLDREICSNETLPGTLPDETPTREPSKPKQRLYLPVVSR